MLTGIVIGFVAGAVCTRLFYTKVIAAGREALGIAKDKAIEAINKL